MKRFLLLMGVIAAMLVAVPASAIRVESAGTTHGVISIIGDDKVVYDASVADGMDPVLKAIETDNVPGKITLTEHLLVDSGATLTEWWELLLVPDGQGGWVPSPDDDDLYFESLSLHYPVMSGTEVGNTGDLAWVQWGEPLAAGTAIEIEKLINVPEGIDSFAILQGPVIPEPSMIVLLGLGLLALLRRKK